jgi:hypothetical protein
MVALNTDEMTQAERTQLMQDMDMRHMLGSDVAAVDGFIFRDNTDVINPQRRRVSLWSMEDGSEIRIRRYRLEDYLRKRDEKGRRRFTLDQSEAPELILGEYKCFLAANSEERVDGHLRAAGLATVKACPAEHLASEFARERHAETTHKQSWATWQRYEEKVERDRQFEQNQRQLDVMMQLAQQAADSRDIVNMVNATLPVCPDCGWQVPADSKNKGASISVHMRRWCPMREGATNEETSQEDATSEG